MSLEVVSFDGKKVGSENVPDIFSMKFINDHVIWEVVKAEQANRRQGTHKTKSRGEIRGGGAKPWRQKGTGRARSGTKTSPVWRGGGVAFGPKPRNYRQNLPRSKKVSGYRNIIGKKLRDSKIVILDNWNVDSVSTKIAFNGFEKVAKAAPFWEDYNKSIKLRKNTNNKRRKITLIVNTDDDVYKKSVRNIPWIEMIHCDRLAALPLQFNHGIIITKEAFTKITENLKK